MSEVDEIMKLVDNYENLCSIVAFGIPCDVSQYELESARDVIKTRIQQIITERDAAKSLQSRLIDEAYANAALANPDVTREMVEQHWSASLGKALERIRGSRIGQILSGDCDV